MSEPYDLTNDPEPVDELQHELERIGRAVGERIDARNRSRIIGEERVEALHSADSDRRLAADIPEHASQFSERLLDRADHAERLADRLAAQQLDAELVQTRLLADCSQARPATAIPRRGPLAAHQSGSALPVAERTVGVASQPGRPIRSFVRRGRGLTAGRGRATDRRVG